MSETNHKTIIKSTAALGIAIVLTKIAGFALEVTLATLYGAGTVTDAFVIAYSVPGLAIVIVTALISGFIPMYHKVNDQAKFMRNIMTCLIIIGLLFSVIFTINPGWIVRLFALRLPPETFELSVYFVRYMVWSTVLVFLVEVFTAHLQINGAFFASGIQTVFSKAIVIGGLILGAVFEYNLFIALAPVIGNVLRMMFLALSSRKHGFFYRPYLDFKSPELRQLLILCSPILLMTIFGQLTEIINRNLAAALPVGSISHLNYSVRTVSLFTLAGSLLVTVLFPHMSKLAADDNIERLRNSLTSGIIYITATMLPVSVGLFFLAQPGVRMLFQRGAFTVEDTIQTAACLRMHAIIPLVGSLAPLLIRAFHACRNTKTPAYTSVVATIAGIGLSFVLIQPFGAEGLALAFSLSGLLGLILLLIFIRKKIGRLGLRSNFPEFFKIISATAIMGLVVWFAAYALPLMESPFLLSILLCAAIVVLAVIVYGGLMVMLKSKTAHECIGVAMEYLSKKRKGADT